MGMGMDFVYCISITKHGFLFFCGTCWKKDGTISRHPTQGEKCFGYALGGGSNDHTGDVWMSI